MQYAHLIGMALFLHFLREHHQSLQSRPPGKEQVLPCYKNMKYFALQKFKIFLYDVITIENCKQITKSETSNVRDYEQ